jgi:hypothetical protein
MKMGSVEEQSRTKQEEKGFCNPGTVAERKSMEARRDSIHPESDIADLTDGFLSSARTSKGLENKLRTTCELVYTF